MAITADYYVDPDSGDDGNAGTSTGAAWATLSKALATVAAGDVVALRHGTGADETPSASIVLNGASGSNAAGYIQIIGVNSSWEDDGTQYSIDGTSLAAGNPIIEAGSNAPDMYRWKNIDAANGPDDGFGSASSAYILQDHIFENCAIHDCTGDGIDGAAFRNYEFYRSTAYNNSNGAKAYYGMSAIFSSIHDNTANAITHYYSNPIKLIGSLFYDNGGKVISNLMDTLIAFNNVFDGNTDDVFGIRSGYTPTVLTQGNRYTNIPTGKYVCNGTVKGLIDYNFYADTANEYGTGVVAIIGDGEVVDVGTNNEGYESLTDGAEDFNLTSGASLRRVAVTIPTA